MSFFSVIILGLNIAILFVITERLRKMIVLQQQFKQLQNNIALLAKENTEIVNVLLADLENKLSEAKETALILEQRAKLPLESERQQALTANKEVENAVVQTPQPRQQSAGSNIIYMRQQGLSVQEIAEQLSVPHGEISLKLNLYEKKNKH